MIGACQFAYFLFHQHTKLLCMRLYEQSRLEHESNRFKGVMAFSISTESHYAECRIALLFCSVLYFVTVLLYVVMLSVGMVARLSDTYD